ncbi:lipoprotein-releasing ABC transporter permease subunit [Cellvibrio sp.]|uniref:lipoprotein-releasing ABC transporter permease subunit n=1 Tax=Cellvibrio sp. TaxID=1965322 RepID=UPI00396488DB
MKLKALFNRFTFLVGARYGISRKHSQLVSFISTLSTAGLVIGVALLIVVMSVMNGFDRELRERILGIMPQAMIYHREGITDSTALIAQLKRDKRVLEAAPFVQIQGLFNHQKHVAPANVFGVDPAQESRLNSLEDYLPPKAFEQLDRNPQGVIVGQGIADKLRVVVGDKISLIIPRSSDANSAPGILMLDVVAILRSNTNVDQTLALMNVNTASQASEFPGKVSGIRLKVNDLFEAPTIVSDLINVLPVGYFGSHWMRTHGTIYEAIHMSKNLVGLLLLLIIGIAAFNLVSTLIMVVVDKQGDIAILRTLGASSKEIIGIFMIQGGLIGLIGTSIGAVLGVILSWVVTDLIAGLEKILGIQFLHSDVYPISYLPSNLSWLDVVQVSATSLFICFFAALYPAWRASRVQPAEALRYE